MANRRIETDLKRRRQSMAFPSQNPRPFTRASIEALNPNQIGVYGIYHQYKWVYVGKGDIRTRLLAHMNDPKITKHGPTHYVTWVTTNGDTVEIQLINELQPVANERRG
jgi:hypothetical protein